MYPKEVLKFKSQEDFFEWKSKVENDTTSMFTKQGRYSTATYDRIHYICHRSANYRPPGLDIRLNRVKESKRPGMVCPARIIADFYQSGKVGATYNPNHLPHSNEVVHIDKEELEGAVVGPVVGAVVGERFKLCTAEWIKKMQTIRQKHRSMSKFEDQEVEMIGANRYTMKVGRFKREITVIGKADHSVKGCDLYCDCCKICLHNLKCTCNDSRKGLTICIHCHYVAFKYNIGPILNNDNFERDLSKQETTEMNILNSYNDDDNYDNIEQNLNLKDCSNHSNIQLDNDNIIEGEDGNHTVIEAIHDQSSNQSLNNYLTILEKKEVNYCQRRMTKLFNKLKSNGNKDLSKYVLEECNKILESSDNFHEFNSPPTLPPPLLTAAENNLDANLNKQHLHHDYFSSERHLNVSNVYNTQASIHSNNNQNNKDGNINNCNIDNIVCDNSKTYDEFNSSSTSHSNLKTFDGLNAQSTFSPLPTKKTIILPKLWFLKPSSK